MDSLAEYEKNVGIIFICSVLTEEAKCFRILELTDSVLQVGWGFSGFVEDTFI